MVERAREDRRGARKQVCHEPEVHRRNEAASRRALPRARQEPGKDDEGPWLPQEPREALRMGRRARAGTAKAPRSEAQEGGDFPREEGAGRRRARGEGRVRRGDGRATRRAGDGTGVSRDMPQPGARRAAPGWQERTRSPTWGRRPTRGGRRWRRRRGTSTGPARPCPRRAWTGAATSTRGTRSPGARRRDMPPPGGRGGGIRGHWRRLAATGAPWRGPTRAASRRAGRPWRHGRGGLFARVARRGRRHGSHGGGVPGAPPSPPRDERGRRDLGAVPPTRSG